MNHRVPEAPPELFHFSRERGAAGNHRPEFPAEAPVNRAKAPPAAEKMLLIGGLQIALKFLKPAPRREIALDLIAHGFNEPRHGD